MYHIQILREAHRASFDVMEGPFQVFVRFSSTGPNEAPEAPQNNLFFPAEG
jgi:hypothetical protein